MNDKMNNNLIKKHNYKLSSEDKKAIMLDYKLDNSKSNIQAIQDKYNISKRTVYDIVNNKNIENSIIDYSSNFTKRANEIIDKMLSRIEKELENNDKINLSQLTTSFGILYDKARLENNLSTSNNSININIKIE